MSPLFWRKRTKGLYCFNFHRIGDWRQTEFDPCVYSCTGEDLAKYVEFIKCNFRVISLDDLKEILAKDLPIVEPLALLTFDDGYRDNYEVAYPVLKKASVPATFFITTSLVESHVVPWWDEIAWHVKQCAGLDIKLSSWDSSIQISPGIAEGTFSSKGQIRAVLQKVKAGQASVDSQLDELRALTGKSIKEEGGESMFMSWSQIRAMVDTGMTVGAHSHSHQVFTGLSEDELKFELSHSKQLLESNLDMEISALSYPVGAVSTYSSSMFAEIEQQGYQLAFSFNAHTNINLQKNRFQLGRIPVDSAFDQRAFMESCLLASKL
ncbi:polysaccharide deacetylase family protein [Motiliproteus sp. MSK22-1]|uniref:polysaccharide deacetylase family protein n=1 Tax=Motiliproteus sp. MSK22-1 TaxID=1897630 RepID=UPI001E5195D9|nr:polysaccharide deacetylase family protein [Motiliproteus sp. MSK22-1]